MMDPGRFSGDERLLLDVVKALRGAEHLRERLLTALQTGTPAVADLAYAIKVRVKEDYKTIEKIKDKRITNPGYSIGNVTDLVGLRIITLYRLDIVEILERLLLSMETDKSEFGTFVSGSISEVKIYSTNPTGDAQNLPLRIQQFFHDKGIPAQIEEKPSNYTSIHILAQGRGKYKDGYCILPVEIQVRTAFEDVWAQIEHTLKYKRKRLARSSGNNRDQQRLETILQHLGVLKTLVDGVAQYGDQIKVQIDEIEPGLRYSSSRSIEEPNVRLARLTDLPVTLRIEIEATIHHVQPLLEDAGASPERIAALSSAADRLIDLSAQVADETGLKPRTIREVEYVLTMQRALVHFQLGNLMPDGEAQLQEALGLYQEMERRFPKRLVVSYRLARTLDAVGQREIAIAKLRDVCKALDNPSEPTPKRHWIQAAAPRVLGVLLWEEANSSRSATASGQELLGLRATEFLLEAFKVTKSAYEKRVRENPDEQKTPSEKAKSANNLLYYLLECLDAGCGPDEGIEEDDIPHYLSDIGAEDPSSLPDYHSADTARRAYLRLGVIDLMRAAARRVIEKLEDGRLANNHHARRALQEARNALLD